MDVSRPRERIISILNDNDCPSFAIRRVDSSPSPKEQHIILSRFERPHLFRYQGYAKQQSPGSEPSTPPLLRHDSSASSTSSSAMDNSPSPITPEYPYLDAQSNVITPYDTLIQQPIHGYLPSPTTITPLMESHMMLVPPMQDISMQYPMKMNNSLPTMPSPAPTSTPLAQGAPASGSEVSQPQPPQPKKNKYPCPYAHSHGCLATFTTSGHAARHGKKHTGEKGVHCPTCGKAFTRKDNMKQHERTHKNSSSTNGSSDDSRKSKAAVTKAAVAERTHKRNTSEALSVASGRKNSVHSPLSEVTSIDVARHALTTPISNPVSSIEEPIMYEEETHSSVMNGADGQTTGMMPTYPPLEEVTLGQMNQRPMPPFPRTFSDLDTLAMAAAYDPYHVGQM